MALRSRCRSGAPRKMCGPACQGSEGKPWGQWCSLEHVPIPSEPWFSLLSNGEVTSSTSLRASHRRMRRAGKGGKYPHTSAETPRGLF